MNYNGNHRWTAGYGTTVTAGVAAGVAGLNAINNGGLGGLFGGGNNKMQEVMSENAMLKAEKSTDEKLLARDKDYVANLKEFYGRFEVVAADAIAEDLKVKKAIELVREKAVITEVEKTDAE